MHRMKSEAESIKPITFRLSDQRLGSEQPASIADLHESIASAEAQLLKKGRT